MAHGVTRRHPSGTCTRATILAASFAVCSLVSLPMPSARSEPIQAGPREPNLMPGQVIDGWTGLPIPCRCLYQGRAYKLGDIVCMNTHMGVVMTRCELFMNNTSWVPTREPCTISDGLPLRRRHAAASFSRASVSPARPFCPAS